MKVLLLFLLLFVFDQETVYKKKQYKEYTLYYSYFSDHAGNYLIGYIVDNKTGQSIYDVNIYEEKTLEGTVPVADDGKHHFKLRLAQKKGRIVFDKPGLFRFYHSYSLE